MVASPRALVACGGGGDTTDSLSGTDLSGAPVWIGFGGAFSGKCVVTITLAP